MEADKRAKTQTRATATQPSERYNISMTLFSRAQGGSLFSRYIITGLGYSLP
jgi:hypothetical protein